MGLEPTFSCLKGKPLNPLEDASIKYALNATRPYAVPNNAYYQILILPLSGGSVGM